jgi:hypothetical protein
MAAKTPDSVIRESLGSLTLLICDFSTTNIDDGDTYATGLGNNIVGDAWMAATLDPTQGGEGMNISKDSGTLTFNAPEDNVTGTVYILART